MNLLVSATKAEAVVGAFKRVRDNGDTTLKSKYEQVKKWWKRLSVRKCNL